MQPNHCKMSDMDDKEFEELLDMTDEELEKILDKEYTSRSSSTESLYGTFKKKFKRYNESHRKRLRTGDKN